MTKKKNSILLIYKIFLLKYCLFILFLLARDVVNSDLANYYRIFGYVLGQSAEYLIIDRIFGIIMYLAFRACQWQTLVVSNRKKYPIPTEIFMSACSGISVVNKFKNMFNRLKGPKNMSHGSFQVQNDV